MEYSPWWACACEYKWRYTCEILFQDLFSLPVTPMNFPWKIVRCPHFQLEVLHGSHIAWREKWKCSALERTFVPIGKRIYCSCHATWLPWKTSIDEFTARDVSFENKHHTWPDCRKCSVSGKTYYPGWRLQLFHRDPKYERNQCMWCNLKLLLFPITVRSIRYFRNLQKIHIPQFLMW